MVSSFGVRIVDNGFIVSWVTIEGDNQLEPTHEEKAFLTKSDMEEFVSELIRKMLLT